MAQALAELEEAQVEPYYDEAADAAERQAYYAGVTEDRSRAPSAERLSALLRSTHTRPVRYDSGRSVYVKAELHEDGLLRSIYSDVTFEPREAIREVVMLDERRKAAEASIAAGNFSEVAALQEIDLLEATSPFNCEHVVPQSWFRKKEPMRGDMHHLFACGSNCNSFRGNTPYYDFPDFEDAIMSDCGKRERIESDSPEDSGFEPERGKAVVARATLYFLLRYPDTISTTSLPADRIDILVGWSKATPPSTYERHRNRTIFQRQGNRNPLIDFPEWAESIRFESLLKDGGIGDAPNEDDGATLPPNYPT
ncbi:MAG: endonuclease [Xanthobacteraceae bacterium]